MAAFERKPHEEFVSVRAETVYGREAIQKQVMAYIQRGEHSAVAAVGGSNQAACAVFRMRWFRRTLASQLADRQEPILLLEGDAGAGKSALIAACVQRLRRSFSHLQIFYHFVGAVLGSTDLVRLLRRMWLELAEGCAMPPSADGLVRGLTDMLERAGRDGGVVVFLDALNQLDADAAQAQLRWLPPLLPAGVRCVVSAIGGTACHTLLCGRMPAPLRLQVGPLEAPAREELIESLLGAAWLDPSTLHQLALKHGAQNALWLVTACGELRHLSKQCPNLQSLVAELPDELLALLEQTLRRVQSQHDEALVVAALCFLECARHGLLQQELRALLVDVHKYGHAPSNGSEDMLAVTSSTATLGGDLTALKGSLHASAQAAVQDCSSVGTSTVAAPHEDEQGGGSSNNAPLPHKRQAPVMLPVEKWAPLFESLQPFLRPGCGTDDSSLDFFHRAVSKAVRRMHLQSKDQYSFWHGRLADFFERCCADVQRRAEELPYHLEKILDNSRLLQSLVQWEVFSQLVASAHGFDLMRYCRVVGGYGVLASAIAEQLRLWASECSAEELVQRRCAVAEFLVKAGQFRAAIKVLREVGAGDDLPTALEARRLGVLGDAMITADCFDGSARGDNADSARGALNRAVALWAKCAKNGEDVDEASLAQALSNLCFILQQRRANDKALDAGRRAIEIFTRLHHPRLAQAEQHMAHVFKDQGQLAEALEMYRSSAQHFEVMGTAKFDTEYACTLCSIAGTLLHMSRNNSLAALAWFRHAVVSCEAITGPDHVEARYYRDMLATFMESTRVLPAAEAQRVRDGAAVELTEDDMRAMRASV